MIKITTWESGPTKNEQKKKKTNPSVIFKGKMKTYQGK